MDFATLRENKIAREKQKYQSYEIYKQLKSALHFNEQAYDKRIEEVLHPKNSPLVPA